MDYRQLLNTLTPDIYESLKRAVELGKWPNGERLTAEQRNTCLQAVIAWDTLHKPEHERVGYIHTEKHDHCGSDGDEDPGHESRDNESLDEPRPLKWS